MKAKAVAQACDNANQRKSLIEQKLGMNLKATGFSGGAVSQNQIGYTSIKAAPKSASYYGGGSFGGFSSIQAVGPEDVSSFGELVYMVSVTVEYNAQARRE